MIGQDMCVHLITDDTYVDIHWLNWTSGGGVGAAGGGFSYTRSMPGNDIGDACDCTDDICTTGIDYTGNLICDPVDPACVQTPVC
jgi:hypothetical protein